MSEPQTIDIEETEDSFGERVSDLLEDMWEKIGRHHEGMSGHVARQKVAAEADLSDKGKGSLSRFPG